MSRLSRCVACVAVCLAVVSRSNGLAEPPDKKISVAELNCEFLVKKKVHMKYGLDFKLSGEVAAEWEQPGFRDAKFAEAAAAVAEVIAGIDADVIVLCEVGDEEDVRSLVDAVRAAGVEYEHCAVCDSTDSTTGQHVAVLSKRPFEKVIQQIPGREGFYTESDDADSEKDTAVSKGMCVQFRAGQEELVNLYAAHLASERGGEEQDAQRVAQASIVRRTYLKDLDAGEHVVVAGDFNDYRGQPALRRIRGLDDMYEDLIQPGGPVFNPQRKKESSEVYNKRVGDHWTYQFNGRRNQIDHILFSHSIKDRCKQGGIAVRFVDTDVKIGDTDHLATDHRAVIVEFSLK